MMCFTQSLREALRVDTYSGRCISGYMAYIHTLAYTPLRIVNVTWHFSKNSREKHFLEMEVKT